MNQREVKIKVLRQNFIKKHQLNPDYFTLQEHNDLEQLEFCDRYLFCPKQTKNTRQQRFVSSIFKAPSYVQSHSIPTTMISASEQKFSRQESQGQQKRLSLNNKVDLIIDQRTKKCHQSNFKITQKLKKGSCITNQKKVLPNYAVYIMKPCSVYPIKMEPRPVSALTKIKKSFSKNSSPLKQRSASEKIHRKRSVLYLQPWNTDENQY